MNERRLFLNAAQLTRSRQQVIVDNQRGPHMHKYASLMHIRQALADP
jgi:hypothetical protein